MFAVGDAVSYRDISGWHGRITDLYRATVGGHLLDMFVIYFEREKLELRVPPSRMSNLFDAFDNS
ncbi:hypothetical protein BU681_11365 [Staphylococcus chromogenes]|nr:hypothetical protein BU681_11365 [Staphylococcus chromogenes]